MNGLARGLKYFYLSQLVLSMVVVHVESITINKKKC